REQGWRTAWWGTGMVLICGVAPIGLLFARSTPEQCGLTADGAPANDRRDQPGEEQSLTLPATLLTPAFWVLALSLALNSLIQGGISLFGHSLVRELGFEEYFYTTIMVIATFAALPANLLTGWKAESWSLRRLVALGLVLLAGSLAGLPLVASR